MSKQASNSILNVPNVLTALRFVLAIVVFVLIPLEHYLAATIVFVIAAGTDWIDGWWARKYQQVTKLGRIFDPFVDKIIICGTFIFLAAEAGSGILPWMAVVIMGREMLVTALRGFIEQQGGDFSAQMSGKLKMVFQCVAVVASLIALRHYQLAGTRAADLPGWLYWTLHVSVWLAAISTVWSGLEYIVAAARILGAQAMISVALGVASLLVLLILSAGASCWTIALLKLAATSRLLPEAVANVASQLLMALGYQPQAPLIPWSPRRPVPWALVDLVGTLVLYAIVILGLRVTLGQLGWLPDAQAVADESKLSLNDKQLLVWANMAASLGLLVVALPLIALRSGATWCDFGLSTRALWADVKLGLAGFVMLAPPVYAIQGVLVYFWKPSKHPLMEMFKESPDAGFFAALFVAAAVVAPIFEEMVFRVLLQGFLEKVFSFAGPVYELVFGSPRLAIVESPSESIQLAQSSGGAAPEIVFLPPCQAPDSNPYAPPAVAEEPGVVAALAGDREQSVLRGLTAWLPIVISSLIFALMHYSHGPDWVPLIILAAGMGYLYQRTHRVVPSLVVHALLNSLSMFGLWLQIYALPEQGIAP